ncbi:MAG: tetratricopeptide repeat protein [Myxococcales bacterium]|nr:tetratricopeptide repeat protein [Myxococcales bacterium]
MRRCDSALLALVLVGLLGKFVRAEEPLTFKERYERTVVLFKSGQYEQAIKEFQLLYQERPLPILLFNLAQSHRKAGHAKEALDLYDRFLREDPKTDLRSETEGYIAEIKAAQEAERLAREKAERERAEREEREAIARAIASEPPPTGFDASGRRIVPPHRPLRILKWTAAAAGVLSVAAGATLLALHGRQTCTLEPGQELCPQRLHTMAGGITGVCVGGALLGTAAVLYALDYRSTQELTLLGPPRLMFAFDERGASIALVGRF